MPPLRVLKFGGTSLGDVERIRVAVDIVGRASAEARCVVVVSAMAGVTRALVDAAALAAAGSQEYRRQLADVVERHRVAAPTLVRPRELEEVVADLDRWADDLGDLVHGAYLVRECTRRTLDSIMVFGELASSALVAAAFRRAGVEAQACDARTIIVTDARFGSARVDPDATEERVRAHFDGEAALQVVTGFIGATPAGETTTLGRGGSDYTASLVGAILDAQRVEIWTDVDGVLSADPRVVPEAFSLPSLTYEELLELSHFGAKVVHPPSVRPARARGIPLVIRNTLHLEFPGTRIAPDGAGTADRAVLGISSIPAVALLRLEGDGMAGVPGTAERLFRALARADVSVILISQASSEHSICFAVEPGSVGMARAEVEQEFALERRAGLIEDLTVESDCAVVAAVGAGMRETPGIAGRLFSLLGRAGINVRAIAQGSSELNISLVVSQEDSARATRELHRAVVAPEGRRDGARIYLAGVGGVGSALLGQLDTIGGGRPDLGLAGVASSRLFVTDAAALDPAAAGKALAAAGQEGGGAALVAAALADTAPLRIFVDCTASVDLPNAYAGLLRGGVHVVAANKRAFSGSFAEYREVRSQARARSYLEATVGAGLPILRTLEDVVATGDAVVGVEGVLSGTLSFLFDRVMEGHTFSEALVDARTRGYTEPDPREDLSGMDVLRKVVILGRAVGLTLEPEDVTLEPVLPGEGWHEGSVEEFLARLPSVDAHFSRLRQQAVEEGTRLCYLGRVFGDAAEVGLHRVDPGHPCHGLRGTDNLIAVTTERYVTPLTIRGAGAGRAVTAAGVLADILRCISEADDGS